MRVDKRAKKILFDTYKGGEPSPVSPADFAYAKAKGYMFDPITIGHDTLLKQTEKLAGKATLERASGAFLASLSSRQLAWRTGLASYVMSERGKRHTFSPKRSCDDPTCTECAASPWCKTCGGLAKYDDHDVNAYSYWRHRGLLDASPLFQFFDLSELERDPPDAPTSDDLKIFDALLAAIDKAPRTETATKLAKRLTDVIPSTKSELNGLLEVLGASGVLAAKKERKGPDTDWFYVDDWRGEDRYDRGAVARLFGMHRKPKSARGKKA